MYKEIFIEKWHISDYSGRRSGDVYLFQGEKLSLCEKLREWVRWGKYLIRYKDILWFCGYEKQNYIRPTFKEIILLFEEYVKDKPLFDLCKKAEKFTEEKRKRWYYSKVHQISKKELDLILDDEIDKYFDGYNEN